MQDTVQRFMDAFNRLNAHNLELLETLYTPDVEFRDPVHELQGREALRDYYGRLYEGVESCHFEFSEWVIDGDRVALVWTMHVRHARFQKGRVITLKGVSQLLFAGDKVRRHHDYFDMGEFIYERVPLLGGLIRLIKSRL